MPRSTRAAGQCPRPRVPAAPQASAPASPSAGGGSARSRSQAKPHAQRCNATGQASAGRTGALPGRSGDRGHPCSSVFICGSNFLLSPRQRMLAAPQAIEAAIRTAGRGSAQSKFTKSGRTPCPAVLPPAAQGTPHASSAGAAEAQTARRIRVHPRVSVSICVTPPFLCRPHTPRPRQNPMPSGTPLASGHAHPAEPHAQRYTPSVPPPGPGRPENRDIS